MSPAFQHLFIGFPFLNGKGFKRDDVYAHMWSHIAASREDEAAKKSRDIVTGEMTPSQIEKAQDLARECVEKNYKGC